MLCGWTVADKPRNCAIIRLVACTTVNVGLISVSPQHHNRFTALSGITRVSRCQKRTSGLTVQGKINRGRHTDHPDGRHSIRTSNLCPPPPSRLFFTGRMPFLPPKQQRHSSSQTIVHVLLRMFHTSSMGYAQTSLFLLSQTTVIFRRLPATF